MRIENQQGPRGPGFKGSSDFMLLVAFSKGPRTKSDVVFRSKPVDIGSDKEGDVYGTSRVYTLK